MSKLSLWSRRAPALPVVLMGLGLLSCSSEGSTSADNGMPPTESTAEAGSSASSTQPSATETISGSPTLAPVSETTSTTAATTTTAGNTTEPVGSSSSLGLEPSSTAVDPDSSAETTGTLSASDGSGETAPGATTTNSSAETASSNTAGSGATDSTSGDTASDNTGAELTTPEDVSTEIDPLTNGTDAGATADGEPVDGCPYSGHIQYQLNGADSWPDDVRERLSAAIAEAVRYYNCYADLTQNLTVNYKPSVPTAEANVDGWMSFGSDRNYMVVATAMHEIGHTMGVGYAPWSELIDNGRWIGPAVVEVMTTIPPEQRDPDMYSQRDYITCDSQHFWPYGLNQAAEYQSQWSLINHVRIVAAMQLDKDAYRRR